MTDRNGITYWLDGPVAWVELDHPSKGNAIDTCMLRRLDAAIQRAQDEAQVMVLCGNGSCFCKGLNFSDQALRWPEDTPHHACEWAQVLAKIQHGRIPAIAALHGAAFGGGFELAASCHLRVAESSAVFALSEEPICIDEGSESLCHVAHLIGAPRLRDMMLTGRVVGAAAAKRAGFVHHVVEDGKAFTYAGAIAKAAGRMVALAELGMPKVAA